MTDSDDEKLIADALRAKAGQSGGVPTTPVFPAGHTDRLPAVDHQAGEPEPSGPLASGWILLLALLLGLATGAVVGLLTVF